MASIDKRVVEMKFDNKAFERGVSTTLGTLDKLKGKLNFDGAAKGLSNLSAAGKNFNLGGMGAGVEAVSAKFSALQVVGVTALATIAHKATSAGLAMAKSLTIAPISGGLGEYEKKLDSIQTILSNTSAAGTNLQQVSAALEDLNRYSDQTIYNFGEMAKNIGTFTAAGVDLGVATNSIKGIANLAALSGSSSEQASTAMYQLSQAISAGRVSLMDWNSVVNAGMGGSVFQRALAETAVAMGKLPAEALKLEGAMKNVKINGESFRDSISAEGGPSWLTSDVLTTALGNFTGDMKEADLVAQGFTKSQAQAIMAQAETAKNAATIVKTGSKLMDTLRESAESGWAQTWELIIGDFEEAPKVFTALNDVIGGFITRTSDARNAMLKVWKDNGGRDAVIRSVSNAFTGLMGVLRPVGEAFRSVFPPLTGERLAELSRALESFTAKMRVGGETAKNIQSIFSGVFSVLKIGLDIVTGIVKAFFGLFMTFGEGTGGVLAMVGLLGDFFTKIQQFLTYTGIIEKFFAVLLSPLLVLKPLIALVSDLVVAFAALASGDISGFTSQFKESFASLGRSIGEIRDKIVGLVGNLGGAFDMLGNYFSVFANRASASGNTVVAAFAGGLANVSNFISRFATDARGAISSLVETFQNAASVGQTFFASLGGAGLSGSMSLIEKLTATFQHLKESMDFSGVFAQFNSGASTVSSGGVAVLSGSFNVIGTILGGIRSLFSGISNTMGPFLSEVSAFFTTLVKKLREYIATLDMQDAVALLNTGFFIALYIALRRFLGNLKDLVGNIGDMIDSITGVFDQLTSTLKTMQTNIRANIILKIAVAVGILVASVYALSKIDQGALKQGLIALSAIFVQIGIMLAVLTRYNPAAFTSAAFGMILLATAIRILVGALEKLGEMEPDVLLRGGAALAVLGAAIVIFARSMTGLVGLPAAAAGLLILSVAITALAGAIKLYASIDHNTLIDGLVGMGAALVVLAAAMRLMPKNMIANAIAIGILAGALVVLAGAVATFGSLDFSTLAKGIGAIAIVLGILAIAANAMTGALPGAAAMVIMAGAIAILAPALALLGALSFEAIAKGLLVVAGVMAIFVVSMYALTPVIAILAIFSSSIMMLGLAMLAAGTGFGIFVAALGALTVIGAAGFGVLIVGIQGLLNLLPLMAQQAGHAVIAFVKVIGDAAPKVMEVVGKLIVAFIDEIAKRIPQIADAGLRMIIGLLTAIRNRIGDIVNLVIDINTIFLSTLASRLPTIIQAGVDFILSFIEGLAKAIRGEKERTGEAGADLAMAIVEGMISGLKAVGRRLPGVIQDLGRDMINAFKSLLGINSPSRVFSGFGGDIVMGAVEGIGKSIGKLASKAKEMGLKAVSSAKEGISNAASAGTEFISKIVSGIGNAAGTLANKAREVIRGAISAAKENLSQAVTIGADIVRGIARGISGGLDIVKEAARKLAKSALDAAKNLLGIESPSKEFQKIGDFVAQGLAKGITGGSNEVTAALDNMTGLLSSAMESAGNDVKTLEEKLAGLMSAEEKDSNAIYETTKALNQAQAELKATTAAHEALGGELSDEIAKIKELGASYDDLSSKLEDANSVLADAKKTRDDYNESIKSKYSDLPEFHGKTNLTQYMLKLGKQVKDTNTFTTAVQKLRDLGLNDELYKEILAKGIDALPFVNQLVDGGAAAVSEINALSSSLVSSASTLADQGSTALYQAGVDTAQALADGIASQLAAVKSEMDRLIEILRVALEEKLKLDAELAKPPPKPKEERTDAEKKGNRNRGGGPAGYVERDQRRRERRKKREDAKTPVYEVPTTTAPTKGGVNRKRRRIGISSSSAYTAAMQANAQSYFSNLAGSQSTVKAPSQTFIQNNYSPKALSSAEIYRRTSSQLSRARS